LIVNIHKVQYYEEIQWTSILYLFGLSHLLPCLFVALVVSFPDQYDDRGVTVQWHSVRSTRCMLQKC